MTGRRTAVLLTLAGAGLLLLAGSRTWANVTVTGGFLDGSELAVSGRRAVSAAIPIALATAAGAVVLATSGRIVRFLVVAGLLIAGPVVMVSSVAAARDTAGLAATAVQDSLRVVDDGGGSGAPFGAGSAVDVTGWPWVATAGGAVILVAGLLALAGGRSWSGPTKRYERAPEPARAQAPAGTWDALSRGEDPTSSPDERT